MSSINRRQALTSTAAAAVGLTTLAACGDESRSTPIAPSAPKGGGPVASTSDVPVGGCHVVSESKVVLTQPEEGTFKCFTAVCPHQSCTVSSSSEGVIPCTCHGSEFSLDDGSVLDGPSPEGLEAVEINVDGESITLA